MSLQRRQLFWWLLCRLGLGVLRSLLLKDRTGVEFRPFGLLLHLHQSLHQVEGVIRGQLTVFAPLERWEFSGGHRQEFWVVEPKRFKTIKVPIKTGLSLKKSWSLVPGDTYWFGSRLNKAARDANPPVIATKVLVWSCILVIPIANIRPEKV